jgi:hypothetical protein
MDMSETDSLANHSQKPARRKSITFMKGRESVKNISPGTTDTGDDIEIRNGGIDNKRNNPLYKSPSRNAFSIKTSPIHALEEESPRFSDTTNVQSIITNSKYDTSLAIDKMYNESNIQDDAYTMTASNQVEMHHYRDSMRGRSDTQLRRDSFVQPRGRLSTAIDMSGPDELLPVVDETYWLRVECPGQKVKIRPEPSVKAESIRMISSGDEIQVHRQLVSGFYRLADNKVNIIKIKFVF